jgi:nucleoside-diphosphate kinase
MEEQTVEKTLSIIKPDGVKKNVIGEVLSRFEKSALKIAALKKITLSKKEAKAFYLVHKERPFYDSLTTFMSEGPVVVLVLEGDNAISRVREIMGATNPANAAPGTIRKDFADSVERNVVHGSDSPESAAVEIPFFFSNLEIH